MFLFQHSSAEIVSTLYCVSKSSETSVVPELICVAIHITLMLISLNIAELADESIHKI